MYAIDLLCVSINLPLWVDGDSDGLLLFLFEFLDVDVKTILTSSSYDSRGELAQLGDLRCKSLMFMSSITIYGRFYLSFLTGVYVGSSLWLVVSSSLFGLGLFPSLLYVSSSVCSRISGDSATSRSSLNLNDNYFFYLSSSNEIVLKSRRSLLFVLV